MNLIIENIKKLSPSEWMAVLIGFCMPLFSKILPILLILLFLSLSFSWKKLKYHKEFKIMTWLFALTYLFYIFGLLSSSNIREGISILEIKLSFLVIPLFFLFHGAFHVLTLRKIFFAFVTGCLVNSFFSFHQAYQCYIEKHWWECFFTGFLGYGFHTTYLAIYYCFALLILVYFLINYFTRLNKYIIFLIVFLLLYFSAFVVMLSSKGGLIALSTVMLVSALYFFYKRGNLRNTVLVVGGLGILITVGIFSSDYARIRLKEAFKTYGMSTHELFEQYKTSTESTAVRLMIWHVAGEEIKKHPLGVGTGDSKSVLLENYQKAGMTGAYDQKLNCHNQFYETALAIGIHGLFVLIIFLLYLLITAVRKRNFLLLWIVVIIILNLFFESMFETQAGVIFFVFFTGLLLTSVPDVIPLQQDEKD